MRILVTGSNGLLGQKLTHRLQEDKGIYLIATSRGRSAVKIRRGEYHALDITNREDVESILRLTKPDVIINTAAMTQVDECETHREACWNSNVTAVEYLIRCCHALHIHLIQVSTDFIFDGGHGPVDEKAEPRPVNFYGESKLAAERLIQDSAISWAILRTVLVFGTTNEMSRSNIVLWVKDSLENQRAIHVVKDQWRTPTLAEDLAEGCYLAAVKKAKGIYNISGKDFLSPYNIAVKTAEFFKLDKSLITPTDSSQFVQPAKRPLTTGFIIDKARNELGYEPHSFDEGLQILANQIG